MSRYQALENYVNSDESVAAYEQAEEHYEDYEEYEDPAAYEQAATDYIWAISARHQEQHPEEYNNNIYAAEDDPQAVEQDEDEELAGETQAAQIAEEILADNDNENDEEDPAEETLADEGQSEDEDRLYAEGDTDTQEQLAEEEDKEDTGLAAMPQMFDGDCERAPDFMDSWDRWSGQLSPIFSQYQLATIFLSLLRDPVDQWAEERLAQIEEWRATDMEDDDEDILEDTIRRFVQEFVPRDDAREEYATAEDPDAEDWSSIDEDSHNWEVPSPPSLCDDDSQDSEEEPDEVNEYVEEPRGDAREKYGCQDEVDDYYFSEVPDEAVQEYVEPRERVAPVRDVNECCQTSGLASVTRHGSLFELSSSVDVAPLPCDMCCSVVVVDGRRVSLRCRGRRATGVAPSWSSWLCPRHAAAVLLLLASPRGRGRWAPIAVVDRRRSVVVVASSSPSCCCWWWTWWWTWLAQPAGRSACSGNHRAWEARRHAWLLLQTTSKRPATRRRQTLAGAPLTMGLPRRHYSDSKAGRTTTTTTTTKPTPVHDGDGPRHRSTTTTVHDDTDDDHSGGGDTAARVDAKMNTDTRTREYSRPRRVLALRVRVSALRIRRVLTPTSTSRVRVPLRKIPTSTRTPPVPRKRKTRAVKQEPVKKTKIAESAPPAKLPSRPSWEKKFIAKFGKDRLKNYRDAGIPDYMIEADLQEEAVPDIRTQVQELTEIYHNSGPDLQDEMWNATVTPAAEQASWKGPNTFNATPIQDSTPYVLPTSWGSAEADAAQETQAAENTGWFAYQSNPDAMDLNAGRAYVRNKAKCHHCWKTGHTRRNCPKRDLPRDRNHWQQRYNDEDEEYPAPPRHTPQAEQPRGRTQTQKPVHGSNVATYAPTTRIAPTTIVVPPTERRAPTPHASPISDAGFKPISHHAHPTTPTTPMTDEEFADRLADMQI
ncbi:hypothetical protein EDB89DRAFT_1917330 [Lactarius sanguifluus]|nr:hypothetical protein EDB89DRAFT_1917330 [Lactarius sanguifluus]